MSERKRYYSFAAHGSAFGGFLTSPTYLSIPTQAMASLSPSGGYGTASCDNFGIPGVLSVRTATTTVQGDGKQTETTVSLEDVNLMDVLKVSRMVVHLVSQPDPAGLETLITPAGSVIEGLTVYGKEVALRSAVDTFDKYPSYTSLERAYVEGALQGLIIEPGTLSAPCTAKEMGGCVTAVGDVKATMYPDANGMRIKDFATLYLGEYRISRYARRLTLLRVELGCDTEGSLSLGDGAGNGHWEPPN